MEMAEEHVAFPNLEPALTQSFLGPESLVNGVWNSILQQVFPPPTYIVAPEYWSTTQKRNDLVVFHVHTGMPVFLMEGKAASTADGNWTSAVAQLGSYLKANVPRIGGYSYGMLALGRYFIVVKFNGGILYRLKQTLYDTDNNTGRDHAADITTYDGRHEALHILGLISQKLAHP